MNSLFRMNQQLPNTKTMTLEDFQKKLFWIASITMTGIIILFIYLYTTGDAYTDFYQKKSANTSVSI